MVKPKAEAHLTVVVPFAYATAHNGEVVQLRKGDVVGPERFTPASLQHLGDIGFVK